MATVVDFLRTTLCTLQEHQYFIRECNKKYKLKYKQGTSLPASSFISCLFSKTVKDSMG